MRAPERPKSTLRSCRRFRDAKALGVSLRPAAVPRSPDCAMIPRSSRLKSLEDKYRAFHRLWSTHCSSLDWYNSIHCHSSPHTKSADNPISNNRAASIDIDGSVWFRSSNGYSPPSIRWSKHDQETFRGIANKFPDVLPGLGFKIPVGSNVLLAFKRIAAQMPHMTTAQVLEFYYWEKNPTRFDDAYLIYDADLHSHRVSIPVVGKRKRA
ncbi:hypothetical protein B0H13DRAFT_2054142 [Mycena leptocephala]|nr:hypothetical protein B0H13DRAFT_2054142 [Mycena leptocephala]